MGMSILRVPLVWWFLRETKRNTFAPFWGGVPYKEGQTQIKKLRQPLAAPLIRADPFLQMANGRLLTGKTVARENL